MIDWIIRKVNIMTHNCFRILKIEKDIQKLVDRVNQLEQTVQCLSDDNQLLIARLHSKENQNG